MMTAKEIENLLAEKVEKLIEAAKAQDEFMIHMYRESILYFHLRLLQEAKLEGINEAFQVAAKAYNEKAPF